jgi:large exoprotein involved in heme utilization and adhesion
MSGVITLEGGGQINASTSTGQTGGSINIGGLSSEQQYLDPAGALTLAGPGSAITAAASGAGDGGSISITSSGTLTEVSYATITCSSLESNAGNLTITAANLVMLNGASIDTTASAPVASASSPFGNGGNITINAGQLVYLEDSDILTRATNVGGNITIDPEFFVLGNSIISAAGAFGDGNILITSSYVLGSSSIIIATGTVSIDSLPLNLAGSLIALPGQLTDDEKRLRESCARSINHEFSSLIVVGRGGTETGPQELRPDFGMTEDSDSSQP